MGGRLKREETYLYLRPTHNVVQQKPHKNVIILQLKITKIFFKNW